MQQGPEVLEFNAFQLIKGNKNVNQIFFSFSLFS